MSNREAVVDDLLALEDGDEVRLATQQYEWKTPFEVEILESVSWAVATGGIWRTRRIRLGPTAGRGSERVLDVVKGEPAPDMGPGYGRLESVTLVDEEDTEPEAPRPSPDERPAWLARDARDVVDGCRVLSRDLDEVLEAIENADHVLDVKMRIAIPLPQAKDVCWELGLRKEHEDTKLIDEPERSERIAELREIYLEAENDEVVA